MRKSGLTGDEAYILSKHGKTTEDLDPLKKEIGKLKDDIGSIDIINPDSGNKYRGVIKVVGGKPILEYDEIITE